MSTPSGVLAATMLIASAAIILMVVTIKGLRKGGVPLRELFVAVVIGIVVAVDVEAVKWLMEVALSALSS